MVRGRSKSRSKHGNGFSDTSMVLNNITSLLSPDNLRKIEKTNLYKQQINSLYAPVGQNGNNLMNSSSISNAKALNRSNLDGLPVI